MLIRDLYQIHSCNLEGLDDNECYKEILATFGCIITD